MFLYFVKTFHSIEKNILYKTLKQYDFGDKLINWTNWINMLCTNPILRIKILWFDLDFERNKARIPISVLLYIFVADILPLKLKGDTVINGANLNMSSEMTYLHHADDLI